MDTSNLTHLLQFVKKCIKMLLMSANTPRGTHAEFDQSVGSTIAGLRKHCGMTQADLAKRLEALGWKVDVSAIARIESGERSLRVAQLQMIAMVLNFPGGDIFNSAGIGGSQASIDAIEGLGRIELALHDLHDAINKLFFLARTTLRSMEEAEEAGDTIEPSQKRRILHYNSADIVMDILAVSLVRTVPRAFELADADADITRRENSRDWRETWEEMKEIKLQLQHLLDETEQTDPSLFSDG